MQHLPNGAVPLRVAGNRIKVAQFDGLFLLIPIEESQFDIVLIRKWIDRRKSIIKLFFIICLTLIIF